MKTAFVTGVTGQDGSYLAELLLNKGYRVIGLKRRTSLICTDRINKIFEDPNFSLEYYSLHDSGVLYRLVNEYEPYEIYNLGAQSHVRVSFDVPEETVETIAMGTLRILETIRNACPHVKFYQASSSEMFGDNPENPQDENTRLMPASPHASSGILFNHEPPRRGETFVTRKITLAAARIRVGRQEKLYLGNLDAKRDWGFAGDYVDAMWRMLQQENPDDYVIATGQTHTVKQLLEEVFNYAGLDIDEHVQIDSRLFRPHEVPLLLGDPSKAKRVLDWEPTVDFKQLARMMYDADLQDLIDL